MSFAASPAFAPMLFFVWTQFVSMNQIAQEASFARNEKPRLPAF